MMNANGCPRTQKTKKKDIYNIYNIDLVLKQNFFKRNVKVTREMSRLGNVSCRKISQRNFKAYVAPQSFLYTSKNSDYVHSPLRLTSLRFIANPRNRKEYVGNPVSSRLALDGMLLL